MQQPSELSTEDYVHLCKQRLRQGDPAGCLAVADEAVAAGQDGVRLVFCRALGLAALNRPFDALRVIGPVAQSNPLFTRLQIQLLASQRMLREIIRSLHLTFDSFPAHAVDFTFFAIQELVFARGFLEAETLVETIMPVFQDRRPNMVQELRLQALFVQENRELYEELAESRPEGLCFASRLGGLDELATVDWETFLKGELPGRPARIAAPFLVDTMTAEGGGGQSCFFDADLRPLAIPELPRHKPPVGYVLNDVRLPTVFGHTHLFTGSGHAVDQLNPKQSPANFGLAVVGEPSRELQSAFVLPPLGDPGFFNAVLNGLYNIAVRQAHFASLPIIVPYHRNPLIARWLDLCGVDGRDVIWGEEASRLTVRHAVVILNEGRLVNENVIGLIRSVVAHRVEPAPFGAARLYISRRKAAQRPLATEAAIEDALISRGFQVVTFETMSMQDQVRAMRDAEIIVAPHGAGLTNLVFAERARLLVELIPEGYHVRGFENLARRNGMDYCGVFGRASQNQADASDSWTLPAQVLTATLDWLDRRLGAA